MDSAISEKYENSLSDFIWTNNLYHHLSILQTWHFFFSLKKVEKQNKLKPHHPKMCFHKLEIKASSLIASYPHS